MKSNTSELESLFKVTKLFIKAVIIVIIISLLLEWQSINAPSSVPTPPGHSGPIPGAIPTEQRWPLFLSIAQVRLFFIAVLFSLRIIMEILMRQYFLEKSKEISKIMNEEDK